MKRKPLIMLLIAVMLISSFPVSFAAAATGDYYYEKYNVNKGDYTQSSWIAWKTMNTPSCVDGYGLEHIVFNKEYGRYSYTDNRYTQCIGVVNGSAYYISANMILHNGVVYDNALIRYTYEGADRYTVSFRYPVQSITKSDFVGTVSAPSGTYPDNGVHTDGFWYVKTSQVPNSVPVLTINSSGDKSINLKQGYDTFTMTGTVSDADNEALTVSSTIGGVTKKVLVSDTKTAKSWTLTWRTSEFNASSTYKGITVSVDDSFGGVAITTYNGVLTVNKSPLYYWNKYSVKQNSVYNLTWSAYNGGSDTVSLEDFATYYTEYTFDKNTGRAYVSSDSAITGFAAKSQFIPEVYKSYGADGLFKYTKASSGSTGSKYWQYHSNATISGTVPTKDQLLQANLLELDGTYPDNGVHSDGYWYIKSLLPNNIPALSITSSGDKSINLKQGQDTFIISGTVSDADNETLTVSATIGGVSKQVSVVNTETAKSWTLTWRTSELPSGILDGIQVTVDDGRGGDSSAKYLGSLTVDKTPLYYWDKYNVENVKEYIPGNEWIFTNSDTSTIGWGYFPTWDIEKDTGKYVVYTSNGVPYLDSGAGVKYTTVPTDGNKYTTYQYINWDRDVIRKLEMQYVAGRFEIDVYHLSPSSQVDKQIRGNIVTSNIQDLDGTYPDDGLHSDGFWYVKKATTNMSPVLTVVNSDIVANKTGNKVILSGTVTDSDGDNVNITSTLAGITKSTEVAGSGSWRLEWALSEIPEGVYTKISIQGNDGNEGIDTIDYTGIIMVDKTDPEITVENDQQSWTSDPIDISVEWSDYLTGINANERKYKLSTSQSLPASWDTADSDLLDLTIQNEGEWYLHVKAMDQAGNETTKLAGPFQYQQQPEIPTLRMNNVGDDWAEVRWTLPSGSFTDGYKYEVENTVTGESWSLDYPSDQIREESLAAGSKYEYRIKAQNHVGESAWSEPIDVLTLPAVPENLKISFVPNNSSSVNVSFEGVQSAESYLLSIKEGTNSIYEEELNTAGEHLVSDIEPGKQYTATVTAINASGYGQSVVLGFLSLPEAPGEFQSVKIKETEVELAWNASLTASLYELLRDNKVSSYSGADLSYTDTGLESGTEYDYSISAKNESGFGDIAYLKDVLTLPGKAKLTVESIEKDAVNFSINPVHGVEQYVIIVNGVEEKELAAETEHFKVDSLYPGTDYTIEVYAQNRSGSGVADKVTLRTLPDKPQGLEITDIGETEAKLTWEPVQGVDKYKVSITDDVYTEISGTEIILTDLVPGTLYQPKVYAGNASGYGEPTEALFLTLPASPNNLHLAEVKADQFTIAWDKVASTNKYVIYNENDDPIGETEELSYTIKKLKPGETYTVFVKAINDTGEGQKSGFTQRTLPANWTVNPNDPNGGSPISIGDRNEHSVVITVDPVEGADQYKVLDGEGNVVGIITAPETATEIGGLESAKEYSDWTIIPINGAGEGQEIAVPAFVTLPSSEFNVSVTDATTSSLTIKVDSSLINEIFVYAMNGKELYRGKDKSFTVRNLKANQTYNLSVWTENSTGEKTEPKATKGQTLPLPSSGGSGTGISNPTVNPDTPEEEKTPSIPDVSSGNKSGFQDIERSFAKSEILALYDKGIVKGTSESEFEPNRKVTRVEFASMLVRALELQEASDVPLTFMDIQQTAWYVPELGAAIQNGVARGFSDKEFRPFDLITREQAAKMLSNSFYQGDLFDGEVAFKDAGAISLWAKPEIKVLSDTGVITGYPDGSFRPKLDLTRAESAVLIYRALVEMQ